MARAATNYLMLHFNAIQQDDVNNTSCENMQQLVVRAKQNLEMVKNAQQEGDTRYKTLARHDADRGILWVNAKVEKCKNTLNTLVIAKHSKYDPLSTYIKQRAYPNQPTLTSDQRKFLWDLEKQTSWNMSDVNLKWWNQNKTELWNLDLTTSISRQQILNAVSNMFMPVQEFERREKLLIEQMSPTFRAATFPFPIISFQDSLKYGGYVDTLQRFTEEQKEINMNGLKKKLSDIMALRKLTIGGRTYTVGKKDPTPNPKAISYTTSKKTTPQSVPTKNPQVQTKNTGKTTPQSSVTNNPQIKTQNDVKVYPTTIQITPTPPPPPIDPQRLQAIQEGRIIVSNGIKTTFTPTSQQLSVLQAMEAQKKAEQDQARENTEWQKQQDKLQAKIQEMEAQRQQTEDFRNRTDEEILQNFIQVQTQKELAGQFDNPQVPTNLNQYLAERGFDVTRPETIPTSVLRPTQLDTPEKLRQAGVAESIIQTRFNTQNKVTNPNNATTNAQVQINTSVPFERGTNWNGLTETPSLPVQLAERHTASTILYTPPNATNINEPIGRSTPLPSNQITTTGLSPPRQTKLSRQVEATADTPSWDKIGNVADFSSLALIGASVLKVL